MDKQTSYVTLLQNCDSVLGGENNPIVWMATLCCLIRQAFGFFWVGFYIVGEEGLFVGPYQGSLGCLHIDLDRGVCGACARSRETIIVPDVNKFPGHIACDSRSNSEIVVPVLDDSGGLRAVLDIDSEDYGTFDSMDQENLERLVARMQGLKWDQLS
jgi:GAF domain-containing protein